MNTTPQKPLPRVAEVAIHPDAVIPCPERRFESRRATSCATCPRFEGLMRISEDDLRLDWSQTFRIVCAHPIARRVTIIRD